MSRYIEVILPLALDRTYTYAIEDQQLQVGCRVEVPFGRHKKYTALVTKIHEEKPDYEIKTIENIIDTAPILEVVHMRFWLWIAQYYMSAIGEVMKAALPSALLLENQTIMKLKNPDWRAISQLDEKSYLLCEALEKTELSLGDIAQFLEVKNPIKIAAKLIEQDLIERKDIVVDKYKLKFEEVVGLQDEKELSSYLDIVHRAPAQRSLLMTFFQLRRDGDQIPVKNLLKAAGTSRSVLKQLVKKNIFYIEEVEKSRILSNESKTEFLFELTPPQEQAYTQILSAFDQKRNVLFQAVSGSGKSVVYMQLAERFLQNKQHVLILTPELSLSTELFSRFEKRFPNQCLLYNSKRGSSELVEIWKTINTSDQVFIVIGTRSSLFLPFQNLGLIIVDEEHEQSYKQQDPSPRYHARDAALYLSKIMNASTLLGTATPSFDVFWNANQKDERQNKFTKVSLDTSYSSRARTSIHLVDLKDAYKKRQMQGVFSKELLSKVDEVLGNGNQILFFQNRKGYASLLQCNSCGHSPECPNCDVKLTLYQHRQALICHYCGFEEGIKRTCSVCKSDQLDHKGVGVEQIQMQLQELYPEYIIKRFDRSSSSRKDTGLSIIEAFNNKEIHMLVGTQVLSRGIDFLNVGLVAVVNVDQLLFYQDYRAHEWAFQRLIQLAGRAGRSHSVQGDAMLYAQSFDPHHPVLQWVVDYNFNAITDSELNERAQFQYPPHVKIIRIQTKSKNFETNLRAAQYLVSAYKRIPGIKVLGPQAPAVSRIRNWYLQNIIIKIQTERNLLELRKQLKRMEHSFNAVGNFQGVRLAYHVDHI